MIPAGALPLATQQFGCPIHLLEYSTILQAVDDQVQEGEEVDFKRELYVWQGGTREARASARGELAKDVTSFANHRGGLLVLGVAEANDRASKAMPVPTTGRFGAWVRSTVASWVAPMPTVQVRQLDDPDDSEQGFYVIAVLPSQDRPHAIIDPSDPERALRYPVRVGRETQWWTPAQVRLQHARQRDRLARRGQVVDDVLNAARPGLADRLWALAIVVPDAAGDWSVGFKRIKNLQRAEVLRSLYGNETWPNTTVPIVGGIRQHDDGQQPGEIALTLIDRHADGSALAALELPINTSREVASFDRMHITDLLLWCVRVGLDHARAAGCYGLATVATTLWWTAASHHVALDRWQQMGAVRVPRAGTPMTGDMGTLGVPRSLPIPATDGDTMTLLTARSAMTPLFQRMGVAEVEIITEDGAVSLSHASLPNNRDRLRQRVVELGWGYDE